MQKVDYAGGAPGQFFYPSWRKRQPYGSAMGLHAAPLRSPFKVVTDAFILSTICFCFYSYLNFSLILEQVLFI